MSDDFNADARDPDIDFFVYSIKIAKFIGGRIQLAEVLIACSH